MEELLVDRILTHVTTQSQSRPFLPASPVLLADAEDALGFAIPNILKLCYLNVGNGGFGPGYGVIGLSGGYESDLGNLLEAYHALKQADASEGKEWKVGLLPFCEWGCNIYSCVDCADAGHPIYEFDGGNVSPCNFTLEDFFSRWLKGKPIRVNSGSESEKIEIINPFTGKKFRITTKRKP